MEKRHNTFDIVLVYAAIIYGIIYSFFPHKVHTIVGIDWLLMDVGYTHPVHKLVGFLMLTFGFFYVSKKFLVNTHIKAGFIMSMALLIDGIVHVFFSEPFETDVYFLVKAAYIFGLAELMYIVKEKYPLFFKYKEAFFALFFIIGFSAYYRFFEIFSNFPLGTRAPTFVIFGSVFSNNFAKAIGWSLVHYISYWSPAFLIKRIKA